VAQLRRNNQYSISCIVAIIPLMKTNAQHQHSNSEENRRLQQQLSFEAVFAQGLSDPQISEYHFQATVMTLQPGALDTVAHRHDCDLFGYVLEGEVEIALGANKPMTYRSGEMFYEKRNVLHSLTRNARSDAGSKILLLFIIKDGRQGYVAEYPVKKN
jgi:quercetin dioxygenase-like cupin family protein